MIDNDWRNGMSVRLANTLNNANIHNKKDALEIYRSGKILEYRNFGWKCYRELARWLGEPEPPIRSMQTGEYYRKYIKPTLCQNK